MFSTSLLKRAYINFWEEVQELRHEKSLSEEYKNSQSIYILLEHLQELFDELMVRNERDSLYNFPKPSECINKY